MQLGIIGFQGVGKTTVFNALTAASHPIGSGARGEDYTGVVDSPDARVEALRAHFKPRKTTFAKVGFHDLSGLKVDAGRKELPGPLLNRLANMDALLHVVRAFELEGQPHPAGSLDPARDIQALESELILNDMLQVERRLERLREERGRSRRHGEDVEKEIALFERLETLLAEERSLREESFSEPEQRLLSGFGLLSRKPLLNVINVEEDRPEHWQSNGGSTILLQGKLEMEIAQLGAEDQQTFLADYGLDETGREKVIWASFELLNRLSFFTVGEDEVRAWTLRSGAHALDAAETIHSDLARGFIRAEVIAWDLLLELGSLGRARSEGKLRLEGKNYPVRDGEIVHIRFNV